MANRLRGSPVQGAEKKASIGSRGSQDVEN